MKRLFSRIVASVFALGFSLAAAASPPAKVHDPQFTLIAESTATDPLTQDIAMNNSGTVVYITTPVVSGWPQIQNAFTSNGKSTTQIAHYECQPICISIRPSINNGGTVALLRIEDHFTFGFFSIDILRNGKIRSIANTSDKYKSMRPPMINDGGDIVYLGPKPGTQSDLAIHLYRNGQATPVPTGPISGLPSLNNAAIVAYSGHTEQGASAIFTCRDLICTPIVDNSGPFDSFSPNPVINNQGTVAFAATLDDQTSGVFKANGGNVQTIADNTDAFSEIQLGTVSINDRNDVAFQATLRSTGLSGIFTSADPSNGKIIAVGDALFGAAVTDLSLCRECLNDRGDVAFYARLSDGRTVIARAGK